ISATGAAATAVVATIVGSTKFSEGAWISMIAMFILAMFFLAIHTHFATVERALVLPEDPLSGSGGSRRHIVIVPVEELNRAVVQTVNYARAISPNVTALHVTDDPEAGHELRRQWE